MTILQDISLKNYNTFGIDCLAKHFISVNNIDSLKAVLKKDAFSNYLFLGGGSNMLLTQDVDALVIHLNFKGISLVSESDNHVLVQVNAGENWHDFVLWCLENNYGGIENLSLIPGNVGTAPIQNIGAYGVELKDVMESCEVLNINTLALETFTNKDCQFEYRNSIFKKQKGKYIVCKVKFKLTKNKHKLHTEYGAISQQLKVMNVENPTIRDVSKAVISIRQSKLPDPNNIGNSGSFFKNPVISKQQYIALQSNFPDIPGYTVSEHEIKVPAGWLIEKAGFKGKRFGDYGVHKKQALVLVNYGNAKGRDILKLAELIKTTINRIFGITIEAEVNIL
ncbi:UDP-N-acetylmuramate dehydrogenase [Hanstruepera flava]|uniref:UDP-N-acetylmuramate dehydrogenase n=1 Tax=Hanstruepera flava TaxID=2930218 RepID=UPI0020288C26|nr:UDP-N-acetylmuramate dehydrogenase [Hanstruepera flava]